MAHGKPAPDVYLTVAARLGIKPDRGASVEASGNGPRSAAAAGMYIIAVPSPRYPAPTPTCSLWPGLSCATCLD